MQKKITTYQLKNFNHNCCKQWLEHCLNKENIKITQMGNGFISIDSENSLKAKKVIQKAGFAILSDKNLIKVEAIKQAVYELIQLQSNQNSIIQKSEYLIEKLGMSYPSISKLFSKYEPITLEKHIIKCKIRKITQLFEYEDYTLFEIAYMMDYSSVQHLSNQFKKETGYTFSEYKHLDIKSRNQLLSE